MNGAITHDLEGHFSILAFSNHILETQYILTKICLRYMENHMMLIITVVAKIAVMYTKSMIIQYTYVTNYNDFVTTDR